MAEVNEAYLHEIQLYIDKGHKSSVHTTVSNSRWDHRYGWHNGAKGQWTCDLLTKGIQTDKNVSAGEQQCQMFNRTEPFYRCLSTQIWIIRHFQLFFSLIKLLISQKIAKSFLKLHPFLFKCCLFLSPVGHFCFRLHAVIIANRFVSVWLTEWKPRGPAVKGNFSLMYSSCHLLLSLNGQFQTAGLLWLSVVCKIIGLFCMYISPCEPHKAWSVTEDELNSMQWT